MDTRVGDIVFVLENYVNDTDVVPNQMGYDFTFIPYSANPQVDGRDVFSVQESLTGSTVLSSALDYEAMEPGRAFYILHVMVADRDDTTSLTSSGTVRINVIDADDQPPEFWYPGCKSPCFTSYSAPIRTDFVGQVTWLEPDAIQARDRDTLDSPVTFSIKQGDPKYYTDYISIDPQTGVPSVIKEVESAETASFLVIVEALETTDRGHSEQTTLWLVIEGRNLSIPSLPTSTSSGEPFRIATIVLGCLFGLILILFIVFVVLTTVAVKKKTMPVLPRAIGKLSADTTTTTSENRSTRESYRSDREADTSGNRSSAGRKLSRDSGVDFLRSLSSPSAMGPALRPGSFLRTEQECETLPANDEIDYVNSATRQRNSRLSTTSASEVVPYPERRVSTVSRSAAQNEDRVGLVGNLSEEVMGLANPVYGLQGQQQHEDRAVDVGVVPMEQVEVRI
nr:hypothetical protein BaRGS_000317 [Batillaria attramentaria]